MNVKILVCCHKQSEIPVLDDFLPIQVGRKNARISLDMQGDDTGENISDLNPFFCELTAQFWAWKNLKNVDIIGLCHYRRFFKFNGGIGRIYSQTEINHDAIETTSILNILKRYDVILPKPTIEVRSVYENFANFMTDEQLQIYIRTFLALYPEYGNVLLKYLNGNKCYHFNMVIMPWSLFCKYNDFLFRILFEARKYIKILPYSFYNRSFGMFSEILLPVFLMKNKLRIKCVPIIFLRDASYVPLWYQKHFPKFIKIVFGDYVKNIRFLASMKKRNSLKDAFWDVYLKNDGIII